MHSRDTAYRASARVTWVKVQQKLGRARREPSRPSSSPLQARAPRFPILASARLPPHECAFPRGATLTSRNRLRVVARQPAPSTWSSPPLTGRTRRQMSTSRGSHSAVAAGAGARRRPFVAGAAPAPRTSAVRPPAPLRGWLAPRVAGRHSSAAACDAGSCRARERAVALVFRAWCLSPPSRGATRLG